MPTVARSSLSPLLLCVCAACTSTPGGLLSQAISGGEPDSKTTAVVGIANLGSAGVSMCSGSLLAPNLVLTARHCVSTILNESQAGGVDCGRTTVAPPEDASEFYVTTDAQFSHGGNFHRVREVVVLPASDESLCGNDQAILILSDNLAPSEAVPLVPKVDGPVAQSEEYSAVGYGATDDQGDGSGLRRRRDQLYVTCVADECDEPQVLSTEWVGDAGVCSGDSGGPALDLSSRVIGVASRGLPTCAAPTYGHVFGWAAWLKDTAIHAANLGGYTAPTWAAGWPTDPQYSVPVGVDCETSACALGRCINDPDGPYCSRLCNDAAPCPDGYSCEGTDSKVCLRVPPLPPPSGGCALGDRPSAPPISLSIAFLVMLALCRRRRLR